MVSKSHKRAAQRTPDVDQGPNSFYRSPFEGDEWEQQAGPSDPDRGRTRPRASSPISLSIPILNRGSRSMNSVPTMRSIMCLSDGEGGGDNGVLSSTRFGAGSSPRSRTNKLLSAMRRSSSHNGRRRGGTSQELGMYSTPEERSIAATPSLSRATSPIRSISPPTVEEIAMGLHISRTPYLGSQHLGGDPLMHEPGHRYGRRATASLPPSRPGTAGSSSSSTRVAVPLRSSLKTSKSAAASSSGMGNSRSTSPSASASSIPSTPRSQLALSRLFHIIPSSSSSITSASTSEASSGSGRSRLDRFLWRGMKGVGRKADGLTSANSSDTELSTPRKAVRFVSIGEDEEGLRSPR